MIAFQKWLDKQTRTAAVIAIAVFCSFSQIAQAKTTVKIDDNYAISYLRGQFETTPYKGELFDVEILENGALIGTADRIFVKSEGAYEGTEFLLQQFEVDNFIVTKDDVSASVQSIQAHNFALRWVGDNVTPTFVNPSDWQDATFEMKNIKVGDEDAGFILTVPHFEITPLKLDHLSNGKVFFSALGFEMPSMQYAPVGDSAKANKFKTRLEEIGLPNLEFSLQVQQQSTIQGEDVVMNSIMQTRIAGFFDLAMRFELYTSEEAFMRLSDASRWGDEAEAFHSNLVAESKLGGFNIHLRDLGARALIEQSGELPPYPIMAEKLEGMITSYMPETGPPIADAIEKFLIEGGALELSAMPAIPFDVEKFAIALFMADLLVHEINLKAIHKP